MWVFVFLFLVAILVLVPLVSMSYLDPLDFYPYLLCAGVGVIVAVLAWVLFGRWYAPPNTVSTVLLLGSIIVPFLFIGIGIGANVWLDRSPSVRHETQVLRWVVHAKGGAECIVQSWRGNNEESISYTPLNWHGPLLSGCKPGMRLWVTTRAGAFGWEWVEKVE